MLPHYLTKTSVTKQAINDKLQGSLATYLRCDGVVNNHIKKGLLLRLKAVNIWQSWKQERDFLALCAPCLVLYL